MKNKSFIRSFIGTAGIQLFAKGITLLTGVLFARALGPEDFGRYGFVISIISLAVLPAIAGLPQLIIREISRYRIDNSFPLLNGMLKWSTKYVISISLLSIFVTAFFTYLGFWSDASGGLILSALILIPLKGFLSKQGAVINGFQRPELAQLPAQVLVPALSLCVVSVLHFFSDDRLTSQTLIYIQIFTHINAVFLSLILLGFVLKKDSQPANPEYQTNRWHKALFPFTILAVVGTMNNELATVMLGFLGSEESVGYFKVAMTGTTVLALGLQSVNAVSAPRIASMYKQNNLVGTQEILSKSVKLGAISSIPFAILLIFFGEYLVTFFFGEDYMPAAYLLSILCIGQIFNICIGSVGIVLNMTGNEKFTLRAQVITLTLTIGLLNILIPLYQAIGAAISVSVGLVFWNVIMAFYVYRLTGLKTWLRF
ncbi:Polysacc_synt_C domain-containing protein [Vibrio chagasii]|nr:Polysacc_synt_C domain-containing protein [Vibrio chagasii]CAH6907136.1 Polysacc_synt_C domain-containing protein [Vibrio chagasii]